MCILDYHHLKHERTNNMFNFCLFLCKLFQKIFYAPTDVLALIASVDRGTLNQISSDDRQLLLPTNGAALAIEAGLAKPKPTPRIIQMNSQRSTSLCLHLGSGGRDSHGRTLWRITMDSSRRSGRARHLAVGVTRKTIN